MTPANFDHLLNLILPHIRKKDTHMRKAIEPGLKLAITLHHMAEGASHHTIAAHYRLGRSTVSVAINDTVIAIWKVLQPIYLQPPAGPTEWRYVAEGYVCRNLIYLLVCKHCVLPMFVSLVVISPQKKGKMDCIDD